MGIKGENGRERERESAKASSSRAANGGKNEKNENVDEKKLVFFTRKLEATTSAPHRGLPLFRREGEKRQRSGQNNGEGSDGKMDISLNST